jgi:sugar-specific transcriptional regulator TrmB
MTDVRTAADILTQLGFSEIEALTYCRLLQDPGATGYRIAKATGKSQANVYSALSSLAAKGAVVADTDSVRGYHAVPTAELLARMSREYQERCAAAAEALTELDTVVSESGIHKLRNPDHVYERASSMCMRAKDSIAFELFHGPFVRLKHALAQAERRGVGVAGLTFNPADALPGATSVLAVKHARTGMWPGEQLTLVTDAKEALVALFHRSSGEVMHAVYTDSIYLSCLLHAAVVDATVLNRDAAPLCTGSFNKMLFGLIPGGFLELLDGVRRKSAPRPEARMDAGTD